MSAASSRLLAGTKPHGPPEFWTLTEAAAALRRRTISSEELTRLCLERIHWLDPKLNSFITVTEQEALVRARSCDRTRDRSRGKLSKDLPPLHGIPVALKDNIDTAGLRTTAGSRVFFDRVPDADAEVAARLRAAGTVLLGKLNLDEMAFAGVGTTSCFGPVHNPWNPDRITGGSSAGSGAALAAGLCYASVGSDDGGSVRIPAAFCGVTGLKTSYGRVSTRGVVPSAYSLDTIGPMTRSAEDAALMLQAMAGFDPKDRIAADAPVPDFLTEMRRPLAELRLGIARDYFFDGLHPDVASAVEGAIALLRQDFGSARDITLPRFQFVPSGSYDVELLHFQKTFVDRNPELYHPWSLRQLRGLESTTALGYVETLKRLHECRRDIRRIFDDVDIVVMPTKRDVAPTIESTVNETYRRPPSNTSAMNRFGVPAISVPCGFSKGGLPIGLQIVGPAFAEGRVLAVARRFQTATDWHRRRPALFE